MTTETMKLYQDVFYGMEPEEVLEMLEEWQLDGGCEAACPHLCWVEPDGICVHGNPSWLIILGLK